MKRLSSAYVISFFLLWLAGGMACPKLVAQTYSEYEVKAAFLFNFGKFVEWPEKAFATPQSPIVIGVIGKDPFGNILEKTVRGRTMNGRPWEIKRFEKPEEIEGCQILFVAGSEKGRIREIMEAVGTRPILTVGDEIEEFCQLGGIINFSSRQSKYGFQINKITADQKKIRISSKLLMLAKIIKPYGS